MYEDDRLVTGKDEIRRPGQVFCMKSEAQTGRMHRPAYHQLRLCVAASDGSHITAARRRVVNVGQTSGGFALLCRLNQRLDMRLHNPRDRFEDGNRNRIAKLLVSLRI